MSYCYVPEEDIHARPYYYAYADRQMLEGFIESNGYEKFTRFTIFNNTDRCVRLITVRKIMPSNFQYICALLIFFCNNAFSFDTHCENENAIIFNCKIKNSAKIISVCRQAIAESHDEKFLQYKYGTLSKVELTFPQGNNVKEGQFSYRRFYSRNSGTRDYDLLFNIGKNEYHISYFEGSKIDGEPLDEVIIKSGMYVKASSGKTIYLECSDDVIEHLDSATVFNVNEVEELDNTR